MQTEEIRMMRLARQHLLTPVTMKQAVQDLCGVQAQFLSNAMHALRIRSCDFDEKAARSQLLKSWTLRGTMHLFAREDLPLMLHEGREHVLRPCDTMEADDRISAERKAFFAGWITEQIGQGVCEREQLKAACAAHGMTQAEEESLFNAWGGVIRALCENGRICHAVQEKKAFQLCPAFEPMRKEEAQLLLARRYFQHYGSATIRDAAYFFAATQKQVKKWLDQLPAETITCAGKTYYALPDDGERNLSMPPVLLLAGFDPLMLGYEKKDSLFLPQEHLRGIFNLAGIVLPAILLNGRVVGRWKKTRNVLMVTLFEALDPISCPNIERAVIETWGEKTHVSFSQM